MKNISRRDFLKGSAAMGVLATMSGIGTASAETTHTYADTIKQDAEYDVVVMGMGAAGMVAAKTAADNGAHVLIAEKMNEALSGEPCGMFSALHQDAINTGASMLVGTDGHRFLNESEIVHHGHLYENGIWENPTFPEHVHYVCDETQMGLIKEAGARCKIGHKKDE